MDIKLKNNHKVAVFLVLLAILIPSAAMLRLYPYFEKQAADEFEIVYKNIGFLENLVHGTYVLNIEEMEQETGEKISPDLVYMPNVAGLVESEWDQTAVTPDEFSEEDIEMIQEASGWYSDRNEYALELHDAFISNYRQWERCFQEMSGQLEYQVLDETGQVILGNTEIQNLESADGYVMKAILRYDSRGRFTAESKSEAYNDEIQNTLYELGSVNPMENYYQDQYRYEEAFTFQNPQNRTYVFGITSDAASVYSEAYNNNIISYYNSGTVNLAFTAMAALAALAAIILPCFYSLHLGNEKIFRIPFEIALSVGILGLGVGYGLVSLVADTNEGILYQEMIKAGFMPSAAQGITVLWNLGCWAFVFAIIYWAVTCLRAVFTLGFVRYLKERTLIGLVLAGICRQLEKVYNGLLKIDFQDRSKRTIIRIVGINFLILAAICSLWFFGIGALIIYSIVLFIVLNKYYTDLRLKYRILLDATNQIAQGDLDVDISEELGVFEPFKEEIQKIQRGFKKAVDEEVKSQHMKTDLITNVSHDLKTPLTAIITYVSLLKEEKVTPEEQKSYIDILEQKSLRLKVLIEDLFEVSKATSRNVTLNLVDVDIVSLLKQVELELSDKIEASSLEFRWQLPEEKIILNLDSQKTYRVFENLIVNITKYALANTRAYIQVTKENGLVMIRMMNISASELSFNPNEITERFIRGDESRNTEGSGLGLAIAKSFVELQQGRMDIEVEADLFKVIIQWPLKGLNVETELTD